LLQNIKNQLVMNEKVGLVVFILFMVALMCLPSVLDAQVYKSVEFDRKGNEYEMVAIMTNGTVVDADADTDTLANLAFWQLLGNFKRNMELSDITLVSWLSCLASRAESRDVEYTESDIEKFLNNEMVPFPVTQDAIRAYIKFSYKDSVTTARP
jgi:hypothetical protein